MEINERLKLLRTEKGLTMDMLVWDINSKYGIDLNKGLVSKWENGINEPSLRYATYLAQYYDVSLDYLIGLTDVKTPARLLAYAAKKQPEETTPTLNLNHPRPSLTQRPTPERPGINIGRRTSIPTSKEDDDFEFEFLNMDDDDKKGRK